MINVKINGREFEFAAAKNLIEAAKDQGIDIPVFCYHPGLPPEGNCRMCLVRTNKAPKLTPACMLEISEGLEVTSESQEIADYRKGLLELILVNHPLDCPICDKSGECDLQDNYFKYSGHSSAVADPKLHKKKLYPVNDRIVFDGERCILCSRCVRFSENISKTRQIGITERGDHATIEVANRGKYDDPYSECIADICPVGALTKTNFRFKKRVWYLQKTESACLLCARQCNIEIHHQNNQFIRSMPRFRPEINQYWMCDAGRDLDFYYQNRLEHPLAKNFTPLSWEEAANKVSDQLLSTLIPEKTAVFLSSQGSCEEYVAMNALCQKLGVQKITIKNDLAQQNGKLVGDDFLISSQKIGNFFAANEIFALANLETILSEIKSGQIDTIIYWGRHSGEFSAGDFTKETRLLQISSFKDELTELAQFSLPSLSALEKSGTFKNIDGIETAIQKAVTICPEAKSESEIFEMLGRSAPCVVRGA